MTASTSIQWRVQVRKSRAHKWVNKGLFETRKTARHHAVLHRSAIFVKHTRVWVGPGCGVGFGNTRVVRYVKGLK